MACITPIRALAPFEILFASIDETLESLPVDYRNSIIESAGARASLNETIGEVRRTLSNVRKTLITADTVLAGVGQK